MYSIKKERYYFYEFETFNFELKIPSKRGDYAG